MKRAKLFLVNGIILTLTTLLMQVISISFNIFVTNKVGTEGMGIYQLIMSVYGFFITVALSGINLAATRVVSEELAKDNPSRS